jgi:aspartyl-tRNA(Asn)/glutamyl-tRNA(Gln) amidotransferase subunit A
MADSGLVRLNISELAPRIKAREVSPVEVMEATLAQVDRLQPALNSFITVMGDQAMAAAREQEAALVRGEYLGPLHGIPVGIKDNIKVAGVLATLGSKVFADYVADEDAHAVALCKVAGAIILGKENLEEFAAGATSNNPHYGAVHNPWSLDHVPGGSSGGGGANVAACATFASLGTDIGGSVRLPGSFCGVVGLKQTFGRVSQRGLLGTSFNGDNIGPLTRSVRDSALVLQAIAGYDPRDPSTVPVPVPDYAASLGKDLAGLRMGIPVDYYFDTIEPEVEDGIRQAISALEELGAKPREVSLPTMKHLGAARIASMVDTVVTNEPYIKDRRHDYSPELLYRTLAAQFVLGRDYSKALKVQRLIKEEYAEVLQEVDFLVTPTSPIAGLRIDAKSFTVAGQEYPGGIPGSGLISRTSAPFNITGLPTISVPCGFDQAGLPIGLQITTRPFEEEMMFRVAHAYEAVSPSRGHRPPVGGSGG